MTVVVCKPFHFIALTVSNGVNISGPYIAEIPPPLQIISVGSIDLKTMPDIHGKSLWRSGKVGEVGSRPPHPGPVYGRRTASLGMCAHGLDGTRDDQHARSVARSNSPEQPSDVS